VDRARMPAPVEPLLGYEFYRLQAGTGRPLEFNRVYGSDAERDFWVRLNDLAYDLADLLQRLEQPAVSTTPDTQTVYVATTTSDLQPQYDALRRELLRHGYAVLPDRELPLRSADLEQTVAAHLQASRLSIHLIGAAYGVVPEGAIESMQAAQARLAAARARTGGLVRLVWIAPGAVSADPRHGELLKTLRDDPSPGRGSDLLETAFEDLRTLALARLAAAREPAPPAAPAVPATAVRIYLVCDTPDLQDVAPLQRFLFDQEFDVTLPAFEGDETALREDHESQLRDCDAVLIWYGTGGDLWLRQKLGDLRKLPGLGRAAPLRAAGILVAPPPTPAKQRLLTRDAIVLQLTGDDLPAALEPFLARLRGATAAA
jgi:hypothetical protein